ncbi:hypothetical protein [Amycolatopsis jejuensis]|uniref:hypothetical protein n=1 Tax=Amycolatopsis jejuensis TaxID=330084 RepID=UPI00068AB717|nr:hypothetical protein [Amycolatopsis jejuensis]
MRRLEAQGLVVLSPSRSACVTPLDIDDLRSTHRLRLMIEPELAALKRETFESAPGDHRWDSHREFHTLLISPAATPWDLRLLSTLFSTRSTCRAEIAAARARAHDQLVEAAARG